MRPIDIIPILPTLTQSTVLALLTPLTQPTLPIATTHHDTSRTDLLNRLLWEVMAKVCQ